jgi:hypothetical protein
VWAAFINSGTADPLARNIGCMQECTHSIKEIHHKNATHFLLKLKRLLTALCPVLLGNIVYYIGAKVVYLIKNNNAGDVKLVCSLQYTDMDLYKRGC